MSDKMISFTKPQRYRFDFGTDNKLYVILFHGELTWQETAEMLIFLKNSSYETMHKAIPHYLEKHHLKYSNFVSMELPLEHGKAVTWVKHLLHSDHYHTLNENIQNTNIFCSVIDHQQTTADGSLEGCCLAMRRISDKDQGCKYNIIGQTFLSAGHSHKEHGYFAIRNSDGNSHLQNIDTAAGEPILPAFGCVDLVELLLHIETIKTKEQAAEISIR